ncbi:usherin [Ambystoma mexicanum]|uniref:usherin n=1 Tax=Ambystoma mexicanum TaxID=8296 RepID=UPI0037E8D31E
MNGSAVFRRLGLFFPTQLFLLANVCTFIPASAPQGHFPKLENVAAFKSVTIVPYNATCGHPERSTFCRSSVESESLQACWQRFCVQDCPHRSSTPSYTYLFSRGLGTCITEDRNVVPPGPGSSAASFIFHNHKDCFSAPPSPSMAASFTLTVWLKPEREGVMCIVEKAADGNSLFKLTISEKETVVNYRTVKGLQQSIRVLTQGRTTVHQWIHLTVQVHQTRISFFINGLEEDNTAFDSRIMTGQIVDTDFNVHMRIGLNFNGSEQFIGRMNDFRIYQVALTNREILEAFSGTLPHLHAQSECRCPGSHPRVHPLAQRHCIPNGAPDTTNDRVLRLHPDAHPVAYINDDDIETSWISLTFANISNVNDGVDIVIDLENGQYQVFFIVIQFFSPQPEALKIQRRKDIDSEWEDWQYFARNCSIFEMDNNGPLDFPNAVNCLQLPRFVPYSQGNVTLSILTPEPNHRPCYNNFYNTPELQEFVKATHVRIRLIGQYHTTEPTVNFRHKYYGVNEITISGRCNCHGHADQCDTSLKPYKCLCRSDSYTDGHTCDRCLPLFNDKPFHQGDQVSAYNCRPCECFNHSTSCHYNSTEDPFPNDHHQGGGGVCRNCLHNTTGRHCELCRDLLYRQVGADLAASDVCKPCDCFEGGTVNRSLLCRRIGGQCNCKRHVSGRQCNRCQQGYYHLRQSHPDGCSPCNCNASGTSKGDITCHQNSGQCTCRDGFIGLKCDRCNFGYKLVSVPEGEACTSCQCNLNGSLNQFCNPFSGQCHCKAEVKGLQCDTCADHFFGLNASGCTFCDCSPEGSAPGSLCDSSTGKCICKPNFGGRRCHDCVNGFYKVHQNSSFACLPCHCDKAGTLDGFLLCNHSTGQCLCKVGVTGLRCNQCLPHMYNLTAGNIHGCQDCGCDTGGTDADTTCDQVTGQCGCLPSRQGRRCDQCKPGFYLPAYNDTNCLTCSCHVNGSKEETCHNLTGQCVCLDGSVTGQRCDRCKDRYYGFDSLSGRCLLCGCYPAGAVNGSCHSVTGQCFCKQFTQGLKCDQCVANASHLDIHNLFGCSKTPSQQPPPNGHVLNSSAISLSWDPPDLPNSNKLQYSLIRDGLEIYNTADQHPYSPQHFRDMPLAPYTIHSYHIETSNVHGTTQSASVTFRTMSGTPTGNIHLTPISPAGPRSSSFHWTTPSNESGPIEHYILACTSSAWTGPRVLYDGIETSTTVSSLSPFLEYNCSVQACTGGGCLESLPVTVVTAQAAPEDQSPPVIQAISSTNLLLAWSPPAKPNGIIIRYEVYMRGVLQTDGQHVPSERRVFQGSGWYSPYPVAESANENALTPPPTSTNLTNLEPYKQYEFRLLVVNMAGSAFSDWVTARTAEAAPVFMPPPRVFSLSSDSLNVSWERPMDDVIRGEALGYSVSIISEKPKHTDDWVSHSEVLDFVEANELFYIVAGLKPYRKYNLTITLCNQIGCVTSEPGTGETLAAAPETLHPPRVKGLNSTSIQVLWNSPEELNGPSPMYQLERMDVSLRTSQHEEVMQGVRFPGHGYYKFHSSTLPVNTIFTGIKVSFRTKEANGLILFAVSPEHQEEYIALQLREGRPYFLFDPQGSAVAASPSNDDGRQYNDNRWHDIVATRIQAVGTITVDGQYTGTSSASSGSSIIGENTGVFVGGLPKGFTITRKDIGDSQIITTSFVGCLSDLYIKKNDKPHEGWDPIKWPEAEEEINTHQSWEGCPALLAEGAHFLGQGFLELDEHIFQGGMNFDISFDFRTDQLNGLLLLAYNSKGLDYIVAFLKDGSLSFMLQTQSNFMHVDLWLGLSYCDGRWKNVLLKKEGELLLARVNGLLEQTLASDEEVLVVNSPLYIGGIPNELGDAFQKVILPQGFGGCMRDVKFTRGAVVNLASVSSSAVRVNLDGCPSAVSPPNCRGNDSIVVYRGKEETCFDFGLQPFTEYLYRVVASNPGGACASQWTHGRTRGSVPHSVPTPSRICSINSYSVEVTWDKPTGVAGVIEKYILKAYNEDRPNVPAATAVVTGTRSQTETLAGLQPFTNYAITLAACTLDGCTESSEAFNISTPQEAPEDVQPPTAKAMPTSLLLSWLAPKKPNGVITQYLLYMNETLVYVGNETEYNISDLAVYSEQQFRLTACTVIGCTNNSVVTVHTAQLPPSGMASPDLTVLGTRSIAVRWTQPKEIHGLLERYIVYVSEDGKSTWDVVYNSTDLFLDYTIQHLLPGTRYFVQLSACTGGGCSVSNASEAATEESAPEGVAAPRIQSHSSDSFFVSWPRPEFPNGIITSYGLYMNGFLVQNSTKRHYYVSGLTPWSLHSFRVQACTTKGCALSPLQEARTLESAPDGEVPILAAIEGSNAVRVKCQAPDKPNGLMIYAVHMKGLFYADQANADYSVRTEERLVHSSRESNEWVSIGGLVPFSNYTVQINASNSRGSLTSDLITLAMPPGAPDGVQPPRLLSAAPTSLQVVWAPPARNNAPGLPTYRLQMRPRHSTGGSLELLTSPSASLSHVTRELQPCTEYDFRVIASNSHGSTYSNWVTMTTEEDAPGPIDPPLVLEVQSRSLVIKWQCPSKPNGRLTHYNILRNGQRHAVVPGHSLNYTVLHLQPYMEYQFSVEGCTSKGCTLSAESPSIRTLPDKPADIPPPELYSDTPTSVIISWQLPQQPNGIVQNFTIERRVKGKEQVLSIVTLPFNDSRTFVDQTAALSPWNKYEYRILASTVNGGTNSSAWSEVTTRPSRPVGVQPPEVMASGPESVEVSWKAPLIPNGEIRSYEIRMPEPRITLINSSSLSHKVANLFPYTNYSITIVACSSGGGYNGGCTESLPTLVTTDPTVPQGIMALALTPISEAFIAVSWQPPLRPNGPHVRYELLRRTIRQPLASNPPEDLNLWYNIYSGTRWFYEDKGLSRFTTYEYKLIVHNEMGYTPGQAVSVTTLAGLPVRGSALQAWALNHTAIHAEWSKPTLQDLQGDVEHYILSLNSSTSNKSLMLQADVNSTLISDLHASTNYELVLKVFNGAHNISSNMVHVATSDGEPEGMLPPEIVILNSTAVRVIWAPPASPNGAVTEYSVYVNEKKFLTGMNETGSYVLGDLLPFTVYNVQMEACTVYACVKSNASQVTTVEGEPADLSAPSTYAISSRSVQINWASPGNPNGILLGYDLLRKALHPCAPLEHQRSLRSGAQCSYIECKIQEDICSDQCFEPVYKECCNGVLYDRKPGYGCCDEKYTTLNINSADICCGGQIHSTKPGYSCCGKYYIRVSAGEMCCVEKEQNRVSVGTGDSCCGAIPYSTYGSQICCAGSLHDGFSQQCCGGQVVNRYLVCCGDSVKGTIHRPLAGMLCCGTEYVNKSHTVCCSTDNGDFKVHFIEDDPVPVKCCETELIAETEECCHGLGYDPMNYVCSDKIPTSMAMKPDEDCNPVALCPSSMSETAYCGRCDFNPTSHICAWRKSARNDSGESVKKGICATAEKTIYSGAPYKYSFTDMNLEPYTTYEYRVEAWNSFGRGSSNISSITTKEDVPKGVGPLMWAKVDNRVDRLHLNWKQPDQPNGIIIHYIVQRDGLERFRGMDLNFTDAGGIKPYQEYSYQLKACTAAGCTSSRKVVAATVQDVPQKVHPPVVTVVNSSTLHLKWRMSGKPNGLIREYRIHQTGKGLIYRESAGGGMQLSVTGLQPHTDYSYILTACTPVGCNSSRPSTGRTAQAAPAGVWTKPRHIVVNSTSVELYWDEPDCANGIISRYQLIRNGDMVFSGNSSVLNFTDVGLQPNSRYAYQLEAATGGGLTASKMYVIQTPLLTPKNISGPYNVTVMGPHSIFIEWDPPGLLNDSTHLEYNVLMNPGSRLSQMHLVGQNNSALVEHLNPYTEYGIRIQACQDGSCGVGHVVYARTAEANPQGMDPPYVEATGSSVITVKWAPPRNPNGIILKYFIYRRPLGAEEEALVFVCLEGSLEFTEASGDLRPDTVYEYRVTAFNSQGSVGSPWTSARTLEAAPRGMEAPWAQATSAYAVFLNWTQPLSPNGVITQYSVLYQENPNYPATVPVITVTGKTHQAHVFGLKPFTTYKIQVVAVNSVGRVSSPWTTVHTLEASPSGLSNFTVEKKENGRALNLHWLEPSQPNGIIKVYNILSHDSREYSGLARQFLFRRLEPYSLYTLVLEVCTAAGCTRSAPQPVQTGETPPAAQPAPTVKMHNATNVELCWSSPEKPNGKITHYEVMVRCEKESTSQDTALKENYEIAYTEYDTDKSTFISTQKGLLPWTNYEYKIRVWNSAGFGDSSWTSVKTSQAAPIDLLPPRLDYVLENPHTILISWTSPRTPNGVLQSYQLHRNSIPFPFSFDASTFNYTDEDLMAYSIYNYTVSACTGGGCSSSEPASIQTLEGAPDVVSPPTLHPISSTQINVSWSPPLIQNGKIIKYMLRVNNEDYSVGRQLTKVISNLQPYTHYNFSLVACTSGGCTSSLTKAVQTMEAPPSIMGAPTVKTTGPESIEVTWQKPAQLNGELKSYALYRDQVLVYAGLENRYHDFTLSPGMEYSYTVSVHNSQGSTISPTVKGRTDPSAPSGMAPPQLKSGSSNQITASWNQPERANGEILSYTLSVRQLASSHVETFLFSRFHPAFDRQTFVIAGRNPYHWYEVRVEACTLLGCTSSEWASIQTPEAPPAIQPNPLIELQIGRDGFKTVPLVAWTSPQQPNGKVLFYEVLRREVASPPEGLASLLVYNGSSTSFQDADIKLKPYTEYEYQVWAVNSAGRTPSLWARCRTGPAAPEGINAPSLQKVSSTSVVANISPPEKPNGVVTLYRLFSATSRGAHVVLSEGTSSLHTIHGLKPFTTYSVGVEACTCSNCCTRGPAVQFTTPAAPPTEQAPPLVKALSSRTAALQWSKPLQPNGIIQNYELQMRRACPESRQPAAKACTPGLPEVVYSGKEEEYQETTLQPYTSYNLRLLAYNSAGSTASEWIHFVTQKEMPTYKAAFSVASNLSTISLDWGQSFLLNGQLKEYVLTEGGHRLYSGFDTSIYLRRTSEKTFFFQVTCTTDVGSVSTPLVKYSTATGLGPVLSAPEAKNGTETVKTKFYTELWFIILMALLGLLVLALFLALILHNKVNKQPYARERPPLVPLQKRTSPTSVYSQNETYTKGSLSGNPCNPPQNDSISRAPSSSQVLLLREKGMEDTKLPGPETQARSQSERTMSALRIPSQGQISQTYSQNSLHRSVSQLLDMHDKKSLIDDPVWDTILQGHDSGMYVDDEDLISTIKSFNSVTKEHTAFTDTPL